MVGIIPALAAEVIERDMLRRAMSLNKGPWVSWTCGFGDMQKLAQTPQLRRGPATSGCCLSVARPRQLERLFAKLFDLRPSSCPPHRLPALSAYHRDHLYMFDAGATGASMTIGRRVDHVDFGGNSNWCGPAGSRSVPRDRHVERYHKFFARDFEIETTARKAAALDLIAPTSRTG